MIDQLIAEDQHRQMVQQDFDARFEHYRSMIDGIKDVYKIETIKELRDYEPYGDELATELIKHFWPPNKYEDIFFATISPQ